MAEDFLLKYKGKKVLVTGHTGFKGAWLCIWLYEIGAKVIGLGLDPIYSNSLFELSGISDKIIDYRIDIRNKEKLIQIIEEESPEIVFHMAAQPLVIDSYEDPIYTYEVNTLGTAYLLEAMRQSKSLNIGIFITTDKVYKNKEWVWPYRESERLGGYDPYSSSKAAAELIISSYRNSFFNSKDYSKHQTSIASVRAGNVIGGGDWAKNRLIPDCIAAINQNQIIELRSPKSVRPWQFVLEPLLGYLLLGSKIIEAPKKYNQSWNFGPESENIITVDKIIEKIIEKMGKGEWKDISNTNSVHEASFLSLDINKAKTKLGWFPVLNFEETIDFTLLWYQNFEIQNVYDLSLNQIKKYYDLWKSKNEN